MTVNTDFQVYPYDTEAIPAILELTRETLGSAPATRKTTEFWNWKHQANPFGQSYGLYAWTESQRMAVGLRVLMRWSFQSPTGAQVKAVRAVDTATHPTFQRRGIFSRLTRQAVKDLTAAGVHLVFNTPNERSLPGYVKLGWQVVERWPLYLKLLKPGRLLTKAIGRGQTVLSQPRFEQFFSPGVLPWDDFEHRYRNELPTFLANWESKRPQHGLRTPRNLDYLRWRYGQHPHIRYGIYALQDTSRLTGFVILRPNYRYGLRETVLTEIFLRTPDMELGRQLLKSTSRQLKGDYLVAHFSKDAVERKLLGRTGFLRVPRRGIVFTVRPLNPLPQDALDPVNWDLTLGDLELF